MERYSDQSTNIVGQTSNNIKVYSPFCTVFSINLSQIVTANTANATRNFEYFSPVCFDNISPKTWSTNTSPVSKKTVPQFCMLLNWARVDKQLDELAKSWVPRISEKVCPCHYCWYFLSSKKN